MITRNLINANINYDGHTRDEIFSLINRWKRLLITRGASRGNVMALAIMSVNMNHIACIFAAAELGIKLFLFSKPLSKDTLHATKMAIFGPMDFTIIEEYMWNEDYHQELFTTYGGELIFQNEIDNISDMGDFQPWDVEPTDVFLFASTSGTTSGAPKPAYYTHKEFMSTIVRNAKVFGINKDSVFLHSINMHHASSMLSSLMPGLMYAEKHFVGSVEIPKDEPRTQNIFAERIQLMADMINDHGVDRLQIAWPPVIVGIIPLLNTNKKVIINISGFTVPKSFYKYAKKKNIEFHSHYGAVDVGGPILVNVVNKESVYKANYLGVQPDSFYDVQFDDEGAYVVSKAWTGTRRLTDKLEKLEDGFYHRGRADLSEEYIRWNDELESLIKEQHGDFTALMVNKIPVLVLWDAEQEYEFGSITANLNRLVDRIFYLKKQDFMVDTKVDITQLKAYLKNNL